MGSRILKILLPFFLLVAFSLHSKEVIFKGFNLRKPPNFQNNTNLKKLITDLDNSGYFRSVTKNAVNKDKIEVIVVEFPLLTSINITGNTINSLNDLSRIFNVKTGVQFNNRFFQDGLKEFYRTNKETGYTHLSVESVKVKDNGELIIHINEGILSDIEVKDNVVGEKTIDHFFRDLIGIPFNSISVKKVMEEMLYTEAFFSINSEVLGKNGKVVLKLKLDKKRLNKLNVLLGYSAFGGIRINFNSQWITKKTDPGFSDLDIGFYSNNKNRLFNLFNRRYGLKRRSGVNGFSLFYGITDLKLQDSEGIILTFLPSYELFIFKNINLSLFSRSGFTSSLSGSDNSLYSYLGISLSYNFNSQMGETVFNTGIRYESSLLTDTEKYSGFVKVKKDLFAGKIKGEWEYSKVTGETYIHSGNYIFTMYEGISGPADLVYPERERIYLGYDAGIINGFFRPGVFFQFYKGKEKYDIFGLNLFLNIRSIPLYFKVFLFKKKINFSAWITFSI